MQSKDPLFLLARLVQPKQNTKKVGEERRRLTHSDTSFSFDAAAKKESGAGKKEKGKYRNLMWRFLIFISGNNCCSKRNMKYFIIHFR